MKYNIETRPSAEGTIIQDLSYEYEGMIALISRQIIHTRDEQIRAALIALGWTPPDHTPRPTPP
jgi:hypothetical protein